GPHLHHGFQVPRATLRPAASAHDAAFDAESIGTLIWRSWHSSSSLAIIKMPRGPIEIESRPKVPIDLSFAHATHRGPEHFSLKVLLYSTGDKWNVANVPWARLGKSPLSTVNDDVSSPRKAADVAPLPHKGA